MATIVPALTDIEIPDGKSTVLRGPSGCGKSTLVRIINGLIATDMGRSDSAAKRSHPTLLEAAPPYGMHNLGGGLFPHMTASRNLTLMARRPSLLCSCAAFCR